jgi:putative transcriptional regulator
VSKKETKNSLGKRLLTAAREARAIARGEADGKTYRIHMPADVDVRKIRRTLGLTQEEFATRFGLPLGTIRDWEQRRRQPDGAARVLLHVIKHEPKAAARARRAEIAEA